MGVPLIGHSHSVVSILYINIHTAPEAFGKTTIASHHDVGFVSEILLHDSHCISFLSAVGLRVRGKFLGVLNANGCTSDFSGILLFLCLNSKIMMGIVC